MSAFLDSLLQGLLVAAAMTAILKFAPRLNATTRYACWWIALVAVVLLPLRSVPLPGNSGPTVAGPLEAQTPQDVRASLALFHDSPNPVVEARTPTVVSADVSPTRTAEVSDSRFLIRLGAKSVMGVVAAAWGAATLVLLIRLAFGYRSLRRLKRSATPAPSALQARLGTLALNAGVRRRFRLVTSDEACGIMVLGLFEPMIVIPRALSAQMSEADFDHVALHELAHLHRYDDWMNLLQKLLQAALPIQPAVFWIDRQLTLERETACDDWVVAFAEKPKHYAASLTRVAELTLRAPGGILCTGVTGEPSQLHRRVRRLLDTTRNAATRVSRKPLAAAAAVVVALSLGLLHSPPVFGLADPVGSKPDAPAAEPVPGAAKSPPAAAVERHERKSLPVAAGGSLKFISLAGGIDVKTHDRPTVELDSVFKADGGQAAETLDLIQYEYKVADGNASITVKWKDDKPPRNARLNNCRHTLLVPAKFDIDVTTGGGDVVAEGVHGRAAAKTSGGAIRLNKVEGQVKADTSGGDISLDTLKGNAELVTSGGSITLSHLDGDVTARTSGGDIRASDVSGRLVGRTSGGSIRAQIGAARDKSVELVTSAGDIRLTVPEDLKADLRAGTSAGEVKCELPVRGTVKRQQVEGEINGGGPGVTLKTSAGNVQITKARPVGR